MLGPGPSQTRHISRIFLQSGYSFCGIFGFSLSGANQIVRVFAQSTHKKTAAREFSRQVIFLDPQLESAAPERSFPLNGERRELENRGILLLDAFFFVVTG